MNTRDMASAVADNVSEELKTEFGVLSIISLISTLYGLWKMCYPDHASVKTYLQGEYNGSEFSKRVMVPAMHNARRAARKENLNMTNEQLEEVAKASLLHAMEADDDVVAACYTQG